MRTNESESDPVYDASPLSLASGNATETGASVKVTASGVPSRESENGNDGPCEGLRFVAVPCGGGRRDGGLGSGNGA